MRDPFYRYEDLEITETKGIMVFCNVCPVIRRTLKGTWVLSNGKKKWVSDTARKRHAHPTKAEAWEAYGHRKRRQVGIYEARLRRAKECLNIAQKEMPGPHH